MTTTELESNFNKHLKKQAAIWEDLKQKLIDKYVKEGYYIWWAEAKAKREVLELRSMPQNIHPMPDYDIREDGFKNEALD